jgi:ankyrin repeat protein
MALLFISYLPSGDKKGRFEVVKELLNKGAEVNAKANNGEIALTLASQGGYREVRELLIKAGAE